MGKSRVILPKKLSADPQRMARVITNTLNSVALDMQTDFNVTTQTWDDKPTFAIESPTPYTRTVGTDDSVYAMLNEGTPPHDIFPRRKTALAFRGPFQSKTLPRQIMSRSGGAGASETVLPRGRGVRHPGTEARAWDATIAKKWDRQVGAIFQRAIDSEVS